MKTRHQIELGFRLAGTVSPCLLTLLLLVSHGASQSQTGTKLTRIVSGVVMTDKNEAVPNVSVVAESESGTTQAATDANSNFRPDCNLQNPNLQDLRGSGGDLCGQITNLAFGTGTLTNSFDPDLTSGSGVRPSDWGLSVSVQQQLMKRA